MSRHFPALLSQRRFGVEGDGVYPPSIMARSSLIRSLRVDSTHATVLSGRCFGLHRWVRFTSSMASPRFSSPISFSNRFFALFMGVKFSLLPHGGSIARRRACGGECTKPCPFGMIFTKRCAVIPPIYVKPWERLEPK